MARAHWPPDRPVKLSNNCFKCQWRERSEWCRLSREDADLMNRSRVCSRYQPGQFIFAQGDPCAGVFTVMDGTVAMRKTDAHGNSVLVRLRHAGETMGYRDFFAGQDFSTSAQTLVPSTVCFIEREAVRSLLDRNPTLGLALLQQVAFDLQQAEETILQSFSLPARTRLAHLLLTLKDRYGRMAEDGSLIIELPLARLDIADILGTRPETITRTIHALDVDGVARFSGRTVIIPDLDRLLDEIEQD